MVKQIWFNEKSNIGFWSPEKINFLIFNDEFQTISDITKGTVELHQIQ